MVPQPSELTLTNIYISKKLSGGTAGYNTIWTGASTLE
jgi:hypothetical protein